MPTHDVVAGVLGLAIGLILANLLGVAFSRIPLIGPYIPIIFSIVFGYLGLYYHKETKRYYCIITFSH